ncbi:MAG: hypothetical protein AB7E72_13255 [Lysobacterales bacterium]
MAGLVGILLLAPLLAVLMGIYWFAATRTPRTAKLQRYDRLALVTSAALTVLAIVLCQHYAPAARGPIWPHVYAALGGFFMMLAALGCAWWLRPRQV